MRRPLWGALGALAVLIATPAFSRNAGIAADGCAGCHRGGREPVVTITADPPRLDPGASTMLTVKIPATNGPLGGFFLTAREKGSVWDVAGQGTKKVAETEVVHSTPKTASDGMVTFQVRFTAPATKGGVDIDVWAVAANGDRARGGDAEGHARLNLSVGCEGIDAFFDRDGDGFGVADDLGKTRVCELGPGYAMKGGDCDDNSKDIFPGAPERCNFWDDNCDGKVNEGLEAVMVYRDNDNDGYGGRNTTDMRVGCGTGMGYSSTNDDCDDNSREVRPGLMETCNNKDDNCNGRVDEGARAICGVGWCRRQATTCDPMTCRPGTPRVEVCNGLDDDCNDQIDEGPDLCEIGEVCFRGECQNQGQAADAGYKPGPVVDAGAGPSSSGGTGGSTTPGNPTSPGDNDPRPRQMGGCAYGGDGADRLAIMLILVALVAMGTRRRRGA